MDVRLSAEVLPGLPSAGTVQQVLGVVNTGFRRGVRELSLNAAAVTGLGFWPNVPPSARPIAVRGYEGPSLVWSIPEAIRVRVVTPDRQGPAVEAGFLINPSDDENLISAALVGALGIVILDAEKGLWRFRDDAPDRERSSETPGA